jgi:hypothetical protein
VSAVYGLYRHGHTAQRAVDRLRAEGLGDEAITVLTSEPREDCAFSQMHKPTKMWWIACGGGLTGLAAATGFLTYAERSWPINVGGLPIVAWWPNLIIMFELTLLGVILATVLTLVVGALLADRKATLYDPAVTDGWILVGVENPGDDAVDRVRQALQTSDDALVKTLT